MKRPLVFWAIFFILGIVCGRYISEFGYIVFFSCAVLSSIILKRKYKTNFTLLLPVFFLVGLFLFSLTKTNLPEFEGVVNVRGKVLETTVTTTGRQRLTLETMEIEKDGEVFPLENKITVLLPEDMFVKMGDLLVIKGNLYLPKSPEYKWEFDSLTYLKTNGYDYQLFANKVIKYGEEPLTLKQKIYGFRERVNKVYGVIFPEDEAGIIKAMVTGYTADIKEETRTLYTESGIAHLLAISGLHIAMLAGIISYFFVDILSVNRRYSSIITMLFLLFYMVFVGARASVVRSVIMVEVLLLGRVIYKEGDSLNSLGLAAIIILGINPYQLFNAGFQLSFVTVLGLILSKDFIINSEGIKETLLQGLKTIITVFIISFPLIAWYFYKVPILASLVNIVVVPLMGFLLIDGILCGIVGLFSINLAIFVGGPAFVILRFYNFVSTNISNIPFATVTTGRLSLWFCVFYYSLLLIIYFKRNTPLFVANLVAIVVVLCGNRLIFKYNQIDFLNVNSGRAAVIRTYDNKVFLVDVGEVEGIEDCLNFYGIKAIDGVFITTLGYNEAINIVILEKSFDIKN
ncbi:MAG: ComEC/Rec2 family competence protein, partial [Anaerotignaceae bacterium]